jgi:hypothetical protein
VWSKDDMEGEAWNIVDGGRGDDAGGATSERAEMGTEAIGESGTSGGVACAWRGVMRRRPPCDEAECAMPADDDEADVDACGCEGSQRLASESDELPVVVVVAVVVALLALYRRTPGPWATKPRGCLSGSAEGSCCSRCWSRRWWWK